MRTTTALALPFLLALLGAPSSQGRPQTPPPALAGQGQIVHLIGKLTDEESIAALSRIPAGGVILLDQAESRAETRQFLKQFDPACVAPVGPLAHATSAMLEQMQLPIRSGYRPPTERLVVAASEPRPLLLQAAHLAGTLDAPLLVTRGKTTDTAALDACVLASGVKEVHAVGKAGMHCRNLDASMVTRYKDEKAVQRAAWKHLREAGPIHTMVVANPHDLAEGRMSTLAPWIARQHRAALLLTDARGSDVETLVLEAAPALPRAESVILVGNLEALPMRKRPNPMEGGRDEFIEMEPLTPTGGAPCSFAVGRLFHKDPNVVALMLARQRLLARQQGTPKALVVSNPGGHLPLLETYSRNTANELKNAGYEVTGLFHSHSKDQLLYSFLPYRVHGQLHEAQRRVARETIRDLLPEQTIFLWEGHHSTLVSDYRVPSWPDPLRPSLIYLQSCLALTPDEAQPFLQRGAVGVIGTSTRTYSGSGGAMSLAYFDALVYEDQTLGGALRNAKNFMLAFAQLKEKRLGEPSKLSGANLRAAWAFTLWGDPTVKLPRAPRPQHALPAVKHEVRGDVIAVHLPAEKHDKVLTEKYQTEMRPNARLAGLRLKQVEDERHPLVPFVFVEVELPARRAGQTPTLRTTLPGTHWTFCYDDRLQRGYLLLTPRTRDEGELCFQVSWN